MSFSSEDEHWMQMALQQAEQALIHEDVPIGAVAVYDGKLIGAGYNRREADHDPTAHAEMIAMRQASQHIGNWRLDDVTLYCTLEPCAMCAGAMVLARLPRLVFATTDPKAGASGSVMDITCHPALNHQVHVEQGLMRDLAAEQIRAFFRMLRARGEK